MDIGYIEYAPEWVLEFIRVHNYKNIKAYAIFEMHKVSNIDEYPALRDRTEEMVKAVKGMAGTKITGCIETKTGSQWHYYGFKPIGAQFARNYRLILA